MSKKYNVDDILSEIKSKKAQQNSLSRRSAVHSAMSENMDDPPFSATPQKQSGLKENLSSPTSSAKKEAISLDSVRNGEQSARSVESSRDYSEFDNTDVFFSSLTSHRHKTMEEERQELLRRKEEEERRIAEIQKQEALRIAELQKQTERKPEDVKKKEDEITDSFFLEQQPADLPPTYASTPFGEIEPTTPSKDQPDPMQKKQTEYQKYVSGFGRKSKKEKSSPEPAPESAAESAPEFNVSSFDQSSEDFFTAAQITEEFEATPLFASEKQTKTAVEDTPNPSFHVNFPKDIEDDAQTAPKPPQQPAKKGKKQGLFRKHPELNSGEELEQSNSRLGSAEIPVPERFPEEEDDSELEDYSSPKDKAAILHDMKNIKTGLLVRIGVMVVLFGLSLYLALAARDIQIAGELLPLPTFIQPERNLRAYMIVSCIISTIGALVCSNTVGGGLLAMLKFRANTDSLPMLALLGTLAQGICYIIKPEYFSTDKADFGSNLYLFFPIALLVLLFNLVGKMLVILRIQNNFKLVASEKLKHAAVFLKDRSLLKEMSKGLSLEEYTIAYPETSTFLSNFLDNSYSEDHAENMSRVLTPVCLLAGIILAVISYLFNKNAAVAISTFTAVMCVSAPLTSTIAANLPLYRLSQRLIPAGAMVSGYSAVEAFSHTEAVILDAKDLFRPSDIVLHGIKPFDQSKIDSVILDAASVVCNTNGMLTDVFNKIIGSNKAMLRPVENVTYEDSMGLSAWVDGKRVLIGNRELMINHGIEVPSNDYEMRFVKDRKNIIYLANSGQLSAMFVISYRPNQQTKEQLNQLAARGMYLIINTSDPNITEEKIHAVYDFPLELVKLMPAKFHAVYGELTATKERSPAKIGFIGSTRMMVTSILNCMTAKTAIDQAVLIQMISLVVGYALVALFSLMGNLSYLSILHLIMFQIIWALIGIIIPNLKKY